MRLCTFLLLLSCARMEMKALRYGKPRIVIAKHVRHCRQSAHSHLQTKRPAGATNEHGPKALSSLYIKDCFIKNYHTKKEFLGIYMHEIKYRTIPLKNCSVTLFCWHTAFPLFYLSSDTFDILPDPKLLFPYQFH